VGLRSPHGGGNPYDSKGTGAFLLFLLSILTDGTPFDKKTGVGIMSDPDAEN
jgi:hypothetical protein